MKKPSEYSTEELRALERRLANPCGELEAFARLGVLAQQWMNQAARIKDRGIRETTFEGNIEYKAADELRARMEGKA